MVHYYALQKSFFHLVLVFDNLKTKNRLLRVELGLLDVHARELRLYSVEIYELFHVIGVISTF